MKGKVRAIIALVLLLVLLPLTLLLTLAQWVPTLAGIWLPAGTRIAFDDPPRLTPHALHIPGLRYYAGDCQLAQASDIHLSHPSRWRLEVGALDVNSACFSQLAKSDKTDDNPRTLAEWQAMLPASWLRIERLTFSPWQQWQGRLELALTPERQQLNYQGEFVKVQANLKGQAMTVSQLELNIAGQQQPVKLVGEFTLPLVPDGVPVQGHALATFALPQQPDPVDAELEWRENAGQLVVRGRDDAAPLLDLPWSLTADVFTVSDGRWRWPYEEVPASGRVGLKVENWRQGLEQAQISGRLNILTEGNAGKGNAVLNLGPGTLSLTNSAMPLRLNGEAKAGQLIAWAALRAQLSGSIMDPQLDFEPGSLLRSRGRLIDALNIEDSRWPLAGVKVTRKGIDGRLQAILRASEKGSGDFTVHLDGRADDFLPDSGVWQWRYWGKGHFTPMQASWDVAGTGEWRDQRIQLNTLSTGFDQLKYDTMTVSQPRLSLEQPIIWVRDAAAPRITGGLSLNAGETHFSGGSVLPPSTLTFNVEGRDPGLFQFKGDLHARQIGPVRLNGRWDGERLRGQAWWPQQSLTVFQPLIPPDWKMRLRDGSLYAQVAFSAAAGRGFEAGGHGVLKAGSVLMPDNEINGVDFVLPFRFADGGWQLGTRGPVSLRIAEVVNQVTARNITADLQGAWPWSESDPLLLTNVSLDVLGGQVTLQQLRMPQHDAALLRLKKIDASEIISALNPKQFAMSGPVDGALPLWLNNDKWLIKDGWLSNPGPMTLRLDKDTADAVVKDNMAAGAAINWLRYMEISRSWTRVDLDNLGELTLAASITGTGRVDGKSSTVHLNYRHQENVFTLWRSLRFGDNLQTWLEQNMALPPTPCRTTNQCEEKQ